MTWESLMDSERNPSAAEQAGRWVPVAERLPEPMTEVLCAFEMDGPGDWRMKCGSYEPKSTDRHVKAFEGWRIFGGGFVPTHWMPLPAAPSASPAEAPAAPWTPEAIAVLGAAQPVAPAGQPAAGVQRRGLSEALYVLDSIDDYIARINGDDRGACELVNVLRALLAAPAVERGVAEEHFQAWFDDPKSADNTQHYEIPASAHGEVKRLVRDIAQRAWIAALSTAGKEQA